MPNDTVPTSGRLSDLLTIEQIHRCVRETLPDMRRRRPGSGRGRTLTLVVLSVASMIVGMSAREITHWALGDYGLDPFTSVRGYGTVQFRCGGGERPLQAGTGTESRSFGIGTGSREHSWAATDRPDPLPVPLP